MIIIWCSFEKETARTSSPDRSENPGVRREARGAEAESAE